MVLVIYQIWYLKLIICVIFSIFVILYIYKVINQCDDVAHVRDILEP